MVVVNAFDSPSPSLDYHWRLREKGFDKFFFDGAGSGGLGLEVGAGMGMGLGFCIDALYLRARVCLSQRRVLHLLFSFCYSCLPVTITTITATGTIRVD